MSLADLIYQHSLRLPEQAAREALDFIQFLEQRYGTEAAAAAPREPGSARGKLTIVDDDDEHLRDFGDYMP